MLPTEYFTYLAFGYAIFAGLLSFVRVDNLWKPHVFNTSLIVSVSCAALGLVLEITDFLHQPKGATLTIMLFPVLFLGYFQLIRLLFKRWKNTEPYITSASSRLGDPPLDLFTSSNKVGKKRKFDHDRKIMAADFVFSFAYALVPALSMFFLIAWLYGHL